MSYVKPKKHLGQHFLTDLSIAKKIADTLPTKDNLKQQVLEIGPGTGVLTQFLLANPNISLKVMEIDEESVDYLKKEFAELENNILFQDFLNGNIDEIFDKQPYYIISNFPYNISSQIFFKILDKKDYVPCICGMLQKEVAERLASKPGKKAYGILSVLLQAYYDIEYLFTVPPGVFNPPPKVDSGVIRVIRNKTEKLDCNEILFKNVVKTAFNQRRKTLRNSLKSLIGANAIATTDKIFDKRPEQLSVNEFVILTNMVEPLITRV